VTFFPPQQVGSAVPFGISAGAAFVFAVILVALILFATEPVPVDITAIGILVALLVVEPLTAAAADLGLLAEGLVVLSDPEAGLSATDTGLSGFASSATLTVLAMFILSDGIQRTGIVQILGRKVAGVTRDSESRQLGATVGLVGPISGFINNTAAVAILLPMVTDLAHKGKTSPSKLLIPLSYASMFGGMLTLIGTSTNILASDLSARLIGRPFTMFEFTQLGVVLLVVGSAYLLTVGRWLTPARIPVERDLTREFEMGEYLTEVVVRGDSPMVGRTVKQALVETPFDVDVSRGDTIWLGVTGDSAYVFDAETGERIRRTEQSPDTAVPAGSRS
jgi:di/tricarboxylate transporter